MIYLYIRNTMWFLIHFKKTILSTNPDSTRSSVHSWALIFTYGKFTEKFRKNYLLDCQKYLSSKNRASRNTFRPKNSTSFNYWFLEKMSFLEIFIFFILPNTYVIETLKFYFKYNCNRLDVLMRILLRKSCAFNWIYWKRVRAM